MKFWAALIIGSIGISAFLTYLNLYKGAQTLEFPPLAAKTNPGRIEFGEAARKDGKPVTKEITQNIIVYDAGTSYVGEEYEISQPVTNSSDGPLELSFSKESCGCIHIYFDSHEVTKTNHEVKIPPQGKGTLRFTWKPDLQQLSSTPEEKQRFRINFAHNDRRFSDELTFEILTNVRVQR
jgi:hypothetical protein